MSGEFEQGLDLALQTRQQRVDQRQAERTAAEKVTKEAHAVLERAQMRFCGEIRSLIVTAVERANSHLAKRPENCRLYEVSGYFTGPLFAGGAACNPIAFELRSDGGSFGESLIVELTRDGMVEAFLGPLRPGEAQANAMRLDFGWEPVLLEAFSASMAHNLILRYVEAVTLHLPIDSARAAMQRVT